MGETAAALTDRDRYWLRQQESWGKSDLSAKEYARKHKLSIHAFYQARKRLRAIGALDAAPPRSPKAKSRPSGGFARVEVPATPGPATACGCRTGRWSNGKALPGPIWPRCSAS